MHSHSSWGIQDTLASSCLNLWSTRPALRLWGQWRPLHRVSWRSVRHTRTDFHIYEHICSSTLTVTYLNTSYISWDFIFFPDIIRRWTDKDQQSMNFNLRFLFLRLFTSISFSGIIWNDVFFVSITMNPQSDQSVNIHIQEGTSSLACNYLHLQKKQTFP